MASTCSTDGLGWPQVKARTAQVRLPALNSTSGPTCDILGCGQPASVGKLCWWHYRQLRKKVPADRGKGLGCYRGMPLKLINELASLKRASEHEWKERRRVARALIFDRAGGRIMNLPRKQRLFVNQVSHESYERYLFECRSLGTPPMSFRAYRRRWYGAQKANYRRFDVPRTIKARF